MAKQRHRCDWECNWAHMSLCRSETIHSCIGEARRTSIGCWREAQVPMSKYRHSKAAPGCQSAALARMNASGRSQLIEATEIVSASVEASDLKGFLRGPKCALKEYEPAPSCWYSQPRI